MSAKGFYVLVACVLVAGMAVAEEDGHETPKSVTSTCFFDSALVSWSAVSEGNLSGYDVFVRAPPEVNYTPVNPYPIEQTSYLITGLSGGTTYEFAVRAVYGGGHSSQMSSQSSCTTA